MKKIDWFWIMLVCATIICLVGSVINAIILNKGTEDECAFALKLLSDSEELRTQLA